MNLSDEQILELHEFLDRLVENNLTSDQKTKLEKLLAESNDARKVYVSFMDMHASLATTPRKAFQALTLKKWAETGKTESLIFFSPGFLLPQFYFWEPMSSLVTDRFQLHLPSGIRF